MRKFNFGERSRFALELQKTDDESGTQWFVDIWAAERWLTCDDNNTFVPFAAGRMQLTLSQLLTDPDAWRKSRPYPELGFEENHRLIWDDSTTGDGSYRAFHFLDWGPITGNVMTCLFREHGVATLTFSFCRPTHHDPLELGRVFVTTLPEWELARVLHDAAWVLIWDWSNRFSR